MSGRLKETPEQKVLSTAPTPNADEADDIVVRIKEGMTREKVRSLERQAQLHRRAVRRRITLLVSVILIGGLGYLGYYYYKHRATLSGAGSKRSADGITVNVSDAPSPTDTYILKQASVTIPNQGDFNIRIYDFYSNKFLKGKSVLSDQRVLEETLSKMGQEINNSSMIIFAGASFEGNPEGNLTLCRQRVDAITQMLKKLGINSQGCWAVRAGELKASQTAQGQGEEEAEEAAARSMGEGELARQRRLMLAIISKGAQSPSEVNEQTVSQLAKAFYNHNLFPTNYDFSGGAPTPCTSVKR